jgi:hypothetical protein
MSIRVWSQSRSINMNRRVIYFIKETFSGFRCWSFIIFSFIYSSDRLCGPERGPLSLVTTEEVLEGKVAAPVYKTEISDRGNPLRWPRYTLYPQQLALTSPTSGGRSVGIVRSRTKATAFSFSFSFRSIGDIGNLLMHLEPV